MNEFVSLIKKMTIANGVTETVTLEHGCPYRNYTAWVAIQNLGVLSVSVQPMFGGYVDGSAVPFTAAGVKKVKQTATDELRPSTRNPDNDVLPLKSELAITNSGGSAIEVNVYILASQG